MAFKVARVSAMPKRLPNPMSLEEIAHRLVLTRQALEISQVLMAKRVGATPQAWNNYETGRKRISIDQALRLCIATGVDLDWIYRGEMDGIPSALLDKIMAILGEPNRTRNSR
jgi:transcriptional regulator with XRE-family HTH domain